MARAFAVPALLFLPPFLDTNGLKTAFTSGRPELTFLY